MLHIAMMAALVTASSTDWSAPVLIRDGNQTCVTYRAQIQGDYLVVSVVHRVGWHTYALDNKLRAEEKLAGKPSLGVEAPTSLRTTGVKTAGEWHQSEPVDMSKPKLRWFRWGFSDTAYFAMKIDPTRVADEVTVDVRGQACDESRCLRVKAALKIGRAQRTSVVGPQIASLVPVRRK